MTKFEVNDILLLVDPRFPTYENIYKILSVSPDDDFYQIVHLVDGAWKRFTNTPFHLNDLTSLVRTAGTLELALLNLDT